MRRDVLMIPLNEKENLIVATDNSGAIGMKPDDVVQVPYDIVSYFSFRVAVMECMAAGAVPISVVINNFCSDDAWEAMNEGISRGISELGFEHLPIIGSTESNFQLLQSAVGITVLGKSNRKEPTNKPLISPFKYAVIGSPLVGEEVINDKHLVAPLSLFKWMCEQEEVIQIVPVGSKGILYKLAQLNPSYNLNSLHDGIDLSKSSGPSTCFLISYLPSGENLVKKAAGSYFHQIS
ncbi:hypothetical protein J6TS2_13800 [Heyndrickxia sporothermodurans]|nr:hypothetical protein J6TS2_13800 [Heyndrickxia sporothermodurans]